MYRQSARSIALASVITSILAAADCTVDSTEGVPPENQTSSTASATSGHAGGATVDGSGGQGTTGASSGGTSAGGTGGATGGRAGSSIAGDSGAAAPDSSVGPEAMATFASVRTILTSSCAITGCHQNGGGTKDIDLRDDTGLYNRLLGNAPSTAPTACKNRPIVVPSMPDQSLLMAIIDAPDGPRMNCAKRMPDGCPSKLPCLSAAAIQLVRDWIAAGAPNR